MVTIDTAPTATAPQAIPLLSAIPIRVRLAAGLVAGPLYVGVSMALALTRDGFVLTRHPWSMLANGDLGWIQMANLAVTGLLVITFATGLRDALGSGRGCRWTPRLLTLFGLGMFVAAFFRADPALGFPSGTPDDYQVMSWHGVGHMLSASTGFVGAIAACFILARRFSADGERRWALASRLVGAFFVVSFAGLASTGSAVGIIAFTLGVVAIFGWILALALRYGFAVGSGDPAPRSATPGWSLPYD
jgi:hypothetical protein